MERNPLKCPKCDLVTFDHLSQCPSCSASFRLNHVLTRRRRDLSRPIYLPATSPPETDGTVTWRNRRSIGGKVGPPRHLRQPLTRRLRSSNRRRWPSGALWTLRSRRWNRSQQCRLHYPKYPFPSSQPRSRTLMRVAKAIRAWASWPGRAAASSYCFGRPASHGVEPGAVATHGDCREPRRCTRARCPGAEGTHDARQSGQSEAGTRSGRRDNRPGVAGMVRTRNRESRRRARHHRLYGVGPDE